MLPLGLFLRAAVPPRVQHAVGLAAGGGDSRTEIGLLSWVALAYSFKFLWAPIVDRYDAPILSRLLGRRRGWMALSQIVDGMGLIGIASAIRSQPGADHRRSPARRFRVGDAGRGHRRLAHRRRRHRPPGHDGGLLSARLSPGLDLRRCRRALHRGVRELAQRLSGHGGADGRWASSAPCSPRASTKAPAAEQLPFAPADPRTLGGSVPPQGPDAGARSSRSSPASACRISSPA